MALRRIIHASITEIKKEAWNTLWMASQPPAVSMMRWEWLAAFEISKIISPADSPTGFVPAHLALYRAEKLVAVAPLYWKTGFDLEWTESRLYVAAARKAGRAVKRRLLGIIPLTPVAGYRFLLDPGESAAELVSELLAGIHEMLQPFGLAQFVHVDLREPHMNRALKDLQCFFESAFTYRWKYQGEENFQEFLARYSSRRRQKIQREILAMGSKRIRLWRARGEQITPDLMQTLHRCYQANQKKHGGDTGPLNEEFFLFLGEHCREFLNLSIAGKNDEILGAALFLEDKDAFYGRWWGALRETEFLHFNVCYYEPIKWAIAEKKPMIDPGFQGDFKRWRGFESFPMGSWIFFTGTRLPLSAENKE